MSNTELIECVFTEKLSLFNTQDINITQMHFKLVIAYTELPKI